MNAILSFIVCIAMLCSPMGALPAQPETATTLTVRNLTIGLNGESVTLAPEARFTAAVGMEEAQLHFELGSGEKTLMPISGAINEDGVRFTLGTGARTYTLSDETFMEMLGMTQDDAAIFDTVGNLVLSYGKVMAMMYDQEKMAAYGQASYDMLEGMLGAQFEETTAEVDGEELPAIQLKGSMAGTGVFKALDVAAECGIPEMEEFLGAFLDVFNLVGVTEQPAESFESLAEALVGTETMDEPGIDMEVLLTTQEPVYCSMLMSGEASGMLMEMASESIVRGDETEMMMDMFMGDGETTAMRYAMGMDYTGPITNPTSMNLAYDVLSENNYSYSYELEDGQTETYTSNSTTGMNIVANSVETDGLETANLEIYFNSETESGYDGDLDSYGESGFVGMNYAEAREEDGSVTGSCALAIESDEMNEPITLSFDLNRDKGTPVDYFANTTEQPLPADTEDPVYNTLTADAMALAADAMSLAADESVIALSELLASLSEYDIEVENYAESEEYEYSTFNSFEEAAAVYDGYIPAYTAPEGYELQEVVVDEYGLNATYASEEGSFDLATYNYEYYGQTEFGSLKDDAIAPIEGTVVEFTSYDGRVGSAEVYAEAGNVFFYFEGLDKAAAEAIIAGLN